MLRQPRIKVIKRDERERLEQDAASSANPKKSVHEAARDLGATVTKWIDEFRHERREECRGMEAILYRLQQEGDASRRG